MGMMVDMTCLGAWGGGGGGGGREMEEGWNES